MRRPAIAAEVWELSEAVSKWVVWLVWAFGSEWLSRGRLNWSEWKLGWGGGPWKVYTVDRPKKPLTPLPPAPMLPLYPCPVPSILNPGPACRLTRGLGAGAPEREDWADLRWLASEQFSLLVGVEVGVDGWEAIGVFAEASMVGLGGGGGGRGGLGVGNGVGH